MIKKCLLSLLLINNMVIFGSGEPETTCFFASIHNFFTSMIPDISARNFNQGGGARIFLGITTVAATIMAILVVRHHYCKFAQRISEKGWRAGFTEGYNRALSEIDEQHLADLEEVKINSFWAGFMAKIKRITPQPECSATNAYSENGQPISIEAAFAEVLALFDQDRITECSLHVKQDETEFTFGVQL